MNIATQRKELLSKLVVIDILPISYSPRKIHLISEYGNAIRTLNLDLIHSIQDAHKLLESHIQVQIHHDDIQFYSSIQKKKEKKKKKLKN